MHIDSHFPEAVAEFLRSGGRIQTIPTIEPDRPKRSSWVDPEAILRRSRPKPAAVLCAEPARPARTQEPTEDEVRELLTEYAAKGYSIRAAADAIGVGEKYAQARVKRYGIAFRVYQINRTDAEIIAEAREHSAAGRGLRETQRLIGVGRERLLRLAEQAGIQFARRQQ